MEGFLLAGSTMWHRIRPYAWAAARGFRAQSDEERQKRAHHAIALLLVAAVAIVKYVTGVTDHDAPFTLYVLAIGASAALGGFEPAFVATLASIVAAGFGTATAPSTGARLLFAVEGLSIAALTTWLRARLATREEWLGTAGATIASLRLGDRRGKVIDAALRHLEDTASETAVVLLDDRGTIAEWRPSAERLYGYRAEQAIGAPASSLFFDPEPPFDLSALLSQAAEGAVRTTAVHRRVDDSPVHVEIEVRPLRQGDLRAFTLTVHDTARRREWDEYRQAATHGQAVLQEAADDARQQVAALESLTDPFLNPLGGAEMVSELLERLRTTVRADGVALVVPERLRGGLLAAQGLQPSGSRAGAERPDLTTGRVALVHNDPARVEQLSSLRWPAAVASLLVVPVVYDGRVWSTIEVVSERPRQVGDWEVALVRIVADRLAAVVVRDRTLAAAS